MYSLGIVHAIISQKDRLECADRKNMENEHGNPIDKILKITENRIRFQLTCMAVAAFTVV